jgi:hypothetical protein
MKAKQKDRVPAQPIRVHRLIIKHNFIQPQLLRSRLFRWFVTNSPASWRREGLLVSIIGDSPIDEESISPSVPSAHHWRTTVGRPFDIYLYVCSR